MFLTKLFVTKSVRLEHVRGILIKKTANETNEKDRLMGKPTDQRGKRTLPDEKKRTRDYVK